MRWLLALLFLTFGLAAHASSLQCSAIFGASRAYVDLQARIEHIRENSPPPDPNLPRNRWRLADRDTAHRILAYLHERGTKTDFEILETVVSVVELTRGRHWVSPFSDHENYEWPERPRTHLFQTDDWNFDTLTGYFFESSSVLSFTKQKDLDYVRLALSVARERPGQMFEDVLMEADSRWHQRALASEPELLRGFLAWKKSFTLAQRRQVVLAQLPTEAHDDGIVAYIQNTRSDLDLYILGEYARQLRQFGVANPMPEELKHIQFTHWRTLKEGLAFGDPDFFAEFLLRTSHDSKRKAFLLRTLASMDRSKHGENFDDAYRDAFERVERATVDQPPPPQYESDLHLFTVLGSEGLNPVYRGDRVPRGLLSDPRAVHMVASWNEKLGQLDLVIDSSRPLPYHGGKLGELMPELAPLLDAYFAHLGRRGAVTEIQLANQKTREFEAMVARNTFIVAMKRKQFSASALVAMGRIFYGGPRWLYWSAHAREDTPVGGANTYIEQDYPKFILPERANGSDVYELGRLLTTSHAAPNSRFGVLNFMAEILENSGARGGAYMDGGPESKRMYEAMGATTVAGPAELGIPVNYKPISILRADVRMIRSDYLRESYEAIHLRKAPNSK